MRATLKASGYHRLRKNFRWMSLLGGLQVEDFEVEDLSHLYETISALRLTLETQRDYVYLGSPLEKVLFLSSL